MTGSAAEGRLAGLRVLVPRPAGNGTDLLAALRRAAAVPVHVPLIEIRSEADSIEMSTAITGLAGGGFDWVAFTSAAAVAAAVEAAGLQHIRRPVASGTRVAAVGAATARALTGAGVRVDLLPAGAGSAAALLAVWPADPPGTRVLLPRSDLAAVDLPDGLRAKGFQVSTVIAYRTVTLPVPTSLAGDLAGGEIDAIVLTSPSTAGALARCTVADATIVVAIGASTARAATAAGMTVTAVAAEPGAAGILAALAEAATARSTVTASASAGRKSAEK